MDGPSIPTQGNWRRYRAIHSFIYHHAYRSEVLNMAETQMEKTELKFLGGLFRNKSKKGDVYYSGKSEDGTSWVLFRNAYWKEGEENKPYFRLHQRVPLGSVDKKTDD